MAPESRSSSEPVIGPETPNPLYVTVMRSKNAKPDIRTVLGDIMGLTKINYNSCNFNDGLPVTVRFARMVGDVSRWDRQRARNVNLSMRRSRSSSSFRPGSRSTPLWLLESRLGLHHRARLQTLFHARSQKHALDSEERRTKENQKIACRRTHSKSIHWPLSLRIYCWE